MWELTKENFEIGKKKIPNLKMIASYLGITDATLSITRSRLSKKIAKSY